MALFTAAALGLAASAPAAGQEPPPDGLSAGRWVLQPLFVVGFTSDDNLFRTSPDSASPRVSDRAFESDGTLTAVLPFRNSRFWVDLGATYRDYQKTKLTRRLATEGEVGTELVFGTGDRLTVVDTYTRGVSEVGKIDEGGELVYDGQPFNLNRWSVVLDRSVPGRRGYRVSVARSDFNYVEAASPSFFDYRGFEYGAEYREPLSPRLWITTDYGGRRFRQFIPAGFGGEEFGVGVPFRKEHSDFGEVGVSGVLGPREPFFVRAGYGVSSFPLSGTREFRGWVASTRWQFAFGPRTFLVLSAWRRPWPSFFGSNAYYVETRVAAQVRRSWIRGSDVGVTLLFSGVRYGEPDPLVGNQVRSDDRTFVEAYANLLLQSRFGFRVSATHQRRTSNFAPARHGATTLFLGMVFGWL